MVSIDRITLTESNMIADTLYGLSGFEMVCAMAWNTKNIVTILRSEPIRQALNACVAYAELLLKSVWLTKRFASKGIN